MILNSYKTNLSCRDCKKYNRTISVTMYTAITGTVVASCPYSTVPEPNQVEIHKPKPTKLQK
ncbi:MAG TPA: hypothetical protein PLL26_02740 [Candidatus Dojkabacteria bacterium]|nr:hypothetical protein [Candidatus Dojkabacteria bacterium]